MPLCWSYARTSTARQAASDRSGLDRQEAALAQWLADHPDYQLAESLVDAGVSAGSGKHRKRGALARFIEGGRSGSIKPGSCLVVESWSRFSREVATESLRTLLNDVWGQGLAISFCTDGVVLTSELIDREDYRLHGLLGAMGQARREWEERSRRSRGAVRKREEQQDQGLRPRGRLPYWIERSNSGELVISPTYGPALLRAVELATNGLGMTLVAERLNREGFPPPPARGSCNQYRPEGPRRWGQGNLTRLFRRPALTGALERKKAGDLPGYYPALITFEQWTRLRESIERRNCMKGAIRGKSHKARNLFQTVLRCGCCGGPVGYTAPAKRARVGHPGYVACRHGSRRLNGCTQQGRLEYDGVEAHCLGRLSTAAWEALLHRPQEEQALHRLEQEAAAQELELAREKAKLEAAERRAEDAWLQADDERTATAERAVKRLRDAVAVLASGLAEVQQALALARSRPRSADQAAAMRARVAEFVTSIRQAEGQDRLAFNRWLLSLEPVIQFRLHPQGHIECLVGGVSQGVQPIDKKRDMAAIEAGMVGYRELQHRQKSGGWTVVARVETDAFEPVDEANQRLKGAAAQALETIAETGGFPAG